MKQAAAKKRKCPDPETVWAYATIKACSLDEFDVDKTYDAMCNLKDHGFVTIEPIGFVDAYQDGRECEFTSCMELKSTRLSPVEVMRCVYEMYEEHHVSIHSLAVLVLGTDDRVLYRELRCLRYPNLGIKRTLNPEEPLARMVTMRGKQRPLVSVEETYTIEEGRERALSRGFLSKDVAHGFGQSA